MPLTYIDSLLNNITMYKLVLFELAGLAVISILFGFLGILPFSGISFLMLLILLLATCYITQKVCDAVLKSSSNVESYAITALILFFILSPILNLEDLILSFVVGVISILSKYVLAIDKKHIFNPAAIAVFFVGLFGFGNSIWWVGSGVLLPFAIIIGFLTVRKIRRFHLLFSFLISASIVNIFLNLQHGLRLDQALSMLYLSSSLIFFGTIMLTEPLTTPPQKKLYMIYGAIVGVFFGAQFHIGPLFASPELALVIGNIYSYIVSPKGKLFLHLSQVKEMSGGMYEFVFKKTAQFQFIPGQYMEWTVPHSPSDIRGNRRYFTISSSPTEDNITIGVKIVSDGSSYKKSLLKLNEKNTVIASQLSGDFTLPKNTEKKLVFVAGGIGITPFRSMIKYLLDTKQKRDIVLIYTASSENEFVYKDVFDNALHDLGIKTIYVLTNAEKAPVTWTGEKGYITKEMLEKNVPDFSKRTFYISGPNRMVESYKHLLKTTGVPFRNIVTDYFPGF